MEGQTNEASEGLASRIGKPIIIGIRPEDVVDRAHANGMGSMEGLQTTVDVVEPLGSEILLYLDYGTETPMIVRAEPRSVFKPGDKVEVLFKPERIHVFDAETELTVL
jgi:multiple sugar transport system ATP-binding protein